MSVDIKNAKNDKFHPDGIDLIKIEPEIANIIPSAKRFEEIHGRKPSWLIQLEEKKKAEKQQRENIYLAKRARIVRRDANVLK